MLGCWLMKRETSNGKSEESSHDDHPEEKIQSLQQQDLERMERDKARIPLDQKNNQGSNPSAHKLQDMSERCHGALVLRGLLSDSAGWQWIWHAAERYHSDRELNTQTLTLRISSARNQIQGTTVRL